MDDLSSKIDSVFENLSKTLIDKQFNSKLVADRVSRLKSFSKKADRAYFAYFKKCTDEFLNEEEKIHKEISDNIEEVETLSENIRQEIAEIAEITDDTHKLIKQSRELSNGIDTVNRRIKSYDEIQRLTKDLSDVVAKTQEIVAIDHQKDAMIVDETLA